MKHISQSKKKLRIFSCPFSLVILISRHLQNIHSMIPLFFQHLPGSRYILTLLGAREWNDTLGYYF